MRLEVKALQMSLAIHTLLLLLVIIFSKDSLNAHKIVVIDLTLMEPVTAGAGVSGDKKTSVVYEPRTKHQKAKPEDVKPVKGKIREEVRKEKTEIKVTQDYENTHMDEHVLGVETVSLVQDSKQSSVSEDQVVGESAGTFLSSARGPAEESLEKGGTAKNTQQASHGGTGDKSVLGGYLESHLSYIKDIIQKNITYPDSARRKGWMGRVTVSFIIANNGDAKDIKVTQSSGFKVLDENAIEAVKRSSPFPNPPVKAQILIPIQYTLH